MCLPSDALLQHLPSYLGFSYLGRGVSLHGCSSKAQPVLLTLDEGYLLTAALPDLQRGIADSLPAEAPKKPKNTVVGSLSLLQWIFLTQELNRGLLHCRQILLIPTRLQIHKVNARPAFYGCFNVWKFFDLITFPYFKISHKLKC